MISIVLHSSPETCKCLKSLDFNSNTKFHIYFEKDARIVVVIRSRYSVFDIVVVIGLKIVVQELYLFFIFSKVRHNAHSFPILYVKY